MCHGTYEHDGVLFLLQISCDVLDSMQKHCVILAANGTTYSFHVFLEWSYVSSIGDTGGIKGRKKCLSPNLSFYLLMSPLFSFLFSLVFGEVRVGSKEQLAFSVD